MKIILRENEEIIKRQRQSVVIFCPLLLLWSILGLLLWAWHLYGQFAFFGKGSIVIGTLIVIAALSIIRKYFLWHASVLAITNQRVLCSVRNGLFSKKVIEILYRDIREVSFEKQGFLPTLFGYGELIMGTSSETQHHFEKIPEPQLIIDLVQSHR